jgi:hypothetical protein
MAECTLPRVVRPERQRVSRALAVLFGLGLIARLAALGLPGTYDVEIQKGWAARAASAGLAGIYGPSDQALRDVARAEGRAWLEYLWQGPLPRTYFTWNGSQEFFVDYPPGSLLVLWLAGTLWGLMAPGWPNGVGFTRLVNLAPLIGSLVIAGLLWRSSSTSGHQRAALFWLNPAVLLAVPVLGYQDTVFGALALGAVLALQRGALAGASALIVAAGLVKPQGALLLPVLAVLLWREGQARTYARAALLAAFTAGLLLAPWWSTGQLLSALDGCRRPFSQLTLAPLGLNLWWLAGWWQAVEREGFTALAEIVTIPAFARWAGFDPRLPARLLVLLASAASMALVWLAPRTDRRFIALAVVLQVEAYALFSTSVHENHTFLAVILAPLLVGGVAGAPAGWPGARRVHAALSAFLFANLFLMVGVGRKLVRLRELRALRAATVVDASAWVAFAHLVLGLALGLWAWRRLRAARALAARPAIR